MAYPITKNLIAGLPCLPYRKGSYEGVVCHSTDNTAPAINERNYEAGGHWKDAFVHYFVDWTSIIQVAENNYQCWGAGPFANERYCQVELCQTSDIGQFKESYSRYVWLIAYLLHCENLEVHDGQTIVSHDWVRKNLGGTTHSDPISYLASHGVSWEQHVKNVLDVYSNVIPCSPSFLLQIIAPSLWYYDKPDWSAKKGIVKAGEVFTVVDTLTIAGSKMYKLKSGNYITANPLYVKLV